MINEMSISHISQSSESIHILNIRTLEGLLPFHNYWPQGFAAYNTAKRTSNRAVHQARSEAEKVALQKIDPRSGDVYRLAKQMRGDNQDVMGEKLLRTMQANSR